MKKDIRLYNVIFPVWMLILLPAVWLVILPANFVIDSLVLLLALKLIKNTEIKSIYKKTILKVWGVGFAADILGSLILLIVGMGFSNLDSNLNKQLEAIYWNAFNNIFAFFYVFIAVMISAILIYIMNYRFSFKHINLNKMEKVRVSLALAILTAPYTFFIPSDILYNYI